MLTARLGRLRDWALFAAAALAPAVAVGVLGLRALANEEAGERREVVLGLAAAAERASRDFEQGTARATGALGALTVDADPLAAAAALDRTAPPFATAVLLARDRSLLVPTASPSRRTPVEAAGALAPARCHELARAVAAPPPRDEDAAAAARRALLAGCPEVTSPSGRFLWPVVALEGVRRGEVGADAVAAWIEANAARLSEPEREATRIDVARVLEGDARRRAERALSAP